MGGRWEGWCRAFTGTHHDEPQAVLGGAVVHRVEYAENDLVSKLAYVFEEPTYGGS